MTQYPDPNTLIAIAKGLKDDNSMIRMGAIRGIESIAGTERWAHIGAVIEGRCTLDSGRRRLCLVAIVESVR